MKLEREAEAILEFLAALPDTIRDAVRANLLTLLKPGSWSGETSLEEELTLYLMGQNNAVSMASAIITATLLLDYVFAARPRQGDTLGKVAAETGDPFLNKMALREPLNVRHHDNAALSWAEHRLSDLSNEGLQQLQMRLVERALRAELKARLAARDLSRE